MTLKIASDLAPYYSLSVYCRSTPAKVTSRTVAGIRQTHAKSEGHVVDQKTIVAAAANSHRELLASEFARPEPSDTSTTTNVN
ncbi:unnamed protein product [Zymoseptoria tritici ST99CH_3D7]|uniref:Uncharacterized protein n=2 Tax=Zymoseptoria tritici TaxID=1047171 RepID=A0A1X7RIP0_ZYMT9|nr:unnamed protein product [Zymoseptoria tritici ST99CH_3D7]SMR45819.1 unnamed protein product [Zymoseptoria tritici ST99CH_1E4]